MVLYPTATYQVSTNILQSSIRNVLQQLKDGGMEYCMFMIQLLWLEVVVSLNASISRQVVKPEAHDHNSKRGFSPWRKSGRSLLFHTEGKDPGSFRQTCGLRQINPQHNNQSHNGKGPWIDAGETVCLCVSWTRILSEGNKSTKPMCKFRMYDMTKF